MREHPAVAAELDTTAREGDGADATDRAEIGRVGVRIGERHPDAGSVLFDELGR